MRSATAPSRTTLSTMMRLPGRDRVERPGEVLWRIHLVRVDEDQVEWAAPLGGELRQRDRAPRRPGPGPHETGRRDRCSPGRRRHASDRPRASMRWPPAAMRGRARSCCTRRACRSRGFSSPPGSSPEGAGACRGSATTAISGSPAVALVASTASSAGSDGTSMLDQVAVDAGPQFCRHCLFE